jgi:hypothetical protein
MSRTPLEKLTHKMRARKGTIMDAVIETLKAFRMNHIFWAPERFQEIHDEEIRRAVRAAFRDPSNFIPNLLQTGTKKDMETFSEAVKEKAPLMYLATMAGFLEMLYSQEQRDFPYSQDLVGWFREKGWKFPQFKFESLLPPSPSSSLPPTPHPSPALPPQPSITVEKIDSV